MSATSARVVGPSTAEIAPIAADGVAEVAKREGDGEGQNAEAKANAVEVVQPVGGLPLQEEDAAERHKALTIARIRLSSAPAVVKERPHRVLVGAEGSRRSGPSPTWARQPSSRR